MKKVILVSLVIVISSLLISWVKVNSGSVGVALDGQSHNFPARRIPTSFPPDIPIYKGASPSGSLVSSGNGGMIVTLKTKDDPNSVVSFYSSKLSSNGWQVKLAQEVGGGNVLSIEKAGRLGTVTVLNGGADQMTKIGIILEDSAAGQ